MIRLLRFAFLACLAIVFVIIAMANRNAVTLTLVPDELAQFLGFNAQVELPLFLVVFGGIVAGLLIGFVWEWMREFKIRSEAGRAKRENAKLSREVKRLKSKGKPQDDVLALLEDTGSPA